MTTRNLLKSLTLSSVLLFALQGCAQKHPEVRHIEKPFIQTNQTYIPTHSTHTPSSDIHTSSSDTYSIHKSSSDTYTKVAVLKEVAPNINPHVLKLALRAYHKARDHGLDSKQILSVIDYSLADTKKRLWVFDMSRNRLLYHTLVAHGKNSGDVYATRFSNSGHSLESSLGLYLTANTYYGRDGYSLRLKGLSRGFNSDAYSRAVVMHGAWYVSENFVRENHRLGRSWGCPAISKTISRPVINTVKDGTLIFAYADNREWLEYGPYVT